MKKLLLGVIAIACGGAPFEGGSSVEGNSTPTLSGGAGARATSGGAPHTPTEPPSAGVSGGGQAGASQGGSNTVVGGPTMGEGGENGGVSSGGGGGQVVGGTSDGPSVRDCLRNWQALDCARICTNSQSDCQAVINCWVSQNSLDNCTQFTTVGISYAHDAERMCCHG